MRAVLLPEEMRAVEARYMDAEGVPSGVLMERAAAAVAERAIRLAGDGEAVFLCGVGNNGGDGYAAARMCREAGVRASILAPYGLEKLQGDARIQADRALATGVPLHTAPPEATPALWVDALFGIGLSRPLDGAARALAERIESDRLRGASVLAVDIASGLDARTGRALGACIRATHTVTFAARKSGHLLLDGLDLSGDLTVAPIGIPTAYFPKDCARLARAEDALSALRPRARNTHKGDYGHLLIVAGSAGMAGAAILAARAALRCGTGLVTVAAPVSVVPILQVAVPCAMCVPLPERDGAISDEAVPALEAALPRKTALAVGPGLSRRASAAALRCLMACDLPAVLDADALNLIAESEDLRAALRDHHIITPHPGEAARLLARPCGGALDDARALQKLGAVALLKGAVSVVAGQRLTLRDEGTPGLARGGSGDVLTGMIGALLAQGYPPEDAAWMGAALHGRLGELTAARLGVVAMTSADLIDDLPALFRG